MEADLLDLLAAVRGDDLDEVRQAELLARLRDDAAFRAAVVAELRLLGMLKAVQSTEPRWLLIEDELGWSAAERTTPPALEDRILDEIAQQPAPQRARSWQWQHWGALLAAVLVGLTALFLFQKREEPAPGRAPPAYVAVVVKLDGARWERTTGPVPVEGSPVPGGKFRLRAGRVTLTLFNGVMLSVQGPADLDLANVDQIFCQQGKLRARVPPGVEGFLVRAPGAAVVDLGTEFGLNVGADGKADLMVFEGKAEVSVLNAAGHTLRSELLEEQRAVSVDPDAGRIQEVNAVAGDYVPAPEMIAPTLNLGAGYAAAVRAARPWGYWRFETLADRRVPNEIAGRPDLCATGPLQLAGSEENRVAHFARTPGEQHFVLDDWTPPRDDGYALELWAMTEEVNVGTLVGLLSRADEQAQKHVAVLELAGRGHHLVHEPCTVRYLDRWPPAMSGGVNVFSRSMYVPFRWHHIVARKVGARLELYLDGELAGTTRADASVGTTACRLLVGRLKQGPFPRLDQTRPFIGRLDELAVYEHPLAPEEIRRHHELGSSGLDERR